MKKKFRRKHYVVEAEPYTVNGELRGWVVKEEEGEKSFNLKEFEERYEEVSVLHRVAPLNLGDISGDPD